MHMDIYTYIHYTFIHIYIYTYIHIYIYTYMHMYIYTYIDIFTYIHIYIYRHIYIYTFTYIYISYVHYLPSIISDYKIIQNDIFNPTGRILEYTDAWILSSLRGWATRPNSIFHMFVARESAWIWWKCCHVSPEIDEVILQSDAPPKSRIRPFTARSHNSCLVSTISLPCEIWLCASI